MVKHTCCWHHEKMRFGSYCCICDESVATLPTSESGKLVGHLGPHKGEVNDRCVQNKKAA